MDNNLIDISVSLYFEVSDAEIFGGKGCKGYTSISYKHCGPNFVPCSEVDANNLINHAIQATAEQLGVPADCVRAITHEEYEANTEGPDDDYEEDDPDEDCIPQF